MSKSDDYEIFTNCTGNENEDFIIILKYLHLSIPSVVILSSLISLNIWTNHKLLLTDK